MLADQNIKDGLIIILVAFGAVLASFILQGNIGISLADEGFLWYGAWRTSLGDIHVRDFMAYDPGRYYWSALWMKMFGEGIMSLRISIALFQAMGLACGLLALSRIIKSRLLLSLATLPLLLWMFPRHKLFEPAISMVLVYYAVLLFERPTLARHFIAGIFVGLAAFFGKNHGFYSFVSFLLIIIYVHFKISGDNAPKKLSAWGAGIILGFSPMIIMMIIVPGFLQSYWESITVLFSLGGTNITLPVPWPWLVKLSSGSLINGIKQLLTGFLFLLIPLYFVGVIIYLLAADSRKLIRNPLFAVSAFIGTAYMHHAFSRADISHLAQGIHPFLLGIMALPVIGMKFRRQVTVVLFLFGLSLFSIGVGSPLYLRLIQKPAKYVEIDIRGDKLWTDPNTAGVIRTVERINSELLGPGEQFLVAPHLPAIYPLLRRKAPLWETYFLFPRPLDQQEAMVSQLKAQNTTLVLLGDIPLDGRDDLRFRNTHRLLWQYINEHFAEVNWEGLPANYRLFRLKSE